MRRIWAWGANSNGQLGLGFKSEQESSPSEVKFDLPKRLQNKGIVFRDVSGGAYHTLVQAFVLPLSPPEDDEIAVDEAEERISNLMDDAREISHETVKIQVSNTFEILCFPYVEIDCDLIATGFDCNFYLRLGQVKSFGDNSYCQLGRKISEQEIKSQGQEVGGVIINKKNFTKLWGGLDYESFNLSHLSDLDLPIFTAISIGLRHGAAIGFDKDLYVWGDNSKYQGGIYQEGGPNGREEFPKLVQLPTKVEFPPSFKFCKIVCGKDFTIAVHESGYLFGCGQNKHGVLLHAPQDVKEFRKFTHIFNHLSNESDIADIRAGWSHVLVLLQDGRVLSWGRNNFGQLGRTSVNPDFDVEPGFVSSLSEKIVSIKCGSEHNLALSESGKVYAWGWNEHDNCGVKVSANEEVKVKIDLAVGSGSQPSFPEPEPMVLEEQFDETEPRFRPCWRKDCILFPTLVPFPDDVPISVIGCGAGSSFAISS